MKIRMKVNYCKIQEVIVASVSLPVVMVVTCDLIISIAAAVAPPAANNNITPTTRSLFASDDLI